MLRQGQALYETGNGSPGGAAIRRRAGLAGPGYEDTGQDVTQLNHDLANLGYAARADITADGWDFYFVKGLALAVQQLEEHLGVVRAPASLRWGRWCSSGERSGSAR